MLGHAVGRWGMMTGLLLAAVVGSAGRAEAVDRYDRAQLYSNASRGTAYLRLGTADASGSTAGLNIQPVLRINLDGSPVLNVFSKVMPIDADGDGRFEFLQYNGLRMMKLWDATGAKRWQIGNAGGRMHDTSAATHRDSAAVLDFDGDGRQDIAHCWSIGGKRSVWRAMVIQAPWNRTPSRMTSWPGKGPIAARAQSWSTLIIGAGRIISLPQ